MMRFIGALLCLGSCLSAYAQQAPSASPSVEYNFDACDGTDNTGNGNDGTIHGVVQCLAGVEGLGLEFDGRSTYMTTPWSPDFVVGSAATYTIWIRPEFYGGWIFREPAQFEDERMVMDGLGHIGVGLYPCLGNATEYTTAILTMKKWTFVAASFDGFNLKLYVNGKLDSTYTGGACQVGTENGTFNMGAWGGSFFRGRLDDFRLYQTTLTDSQILKIYKTTRSKAPTEGVAEIE
jgi:hypothetical protein